MPITLKEQLISSLIALDLYKNKKVKELEDLVIFLRKKTTKIPEEGSERDLIDFLVVLFRKYPQVLQDSDNNQHLINFCLTHLNQPDQKYKPPAKY